MRSYQEIIEGDKFDVNDSYRVDTDLPKMCWGCEKRYNSGHMVMDTTKSRRIFFCQNCFEKL